NMLKAVLDARERLLKPSGVIIPEAVQAQFCPVQLPNWYASTIECWGQPHMGFRYDVVRHIAVNQTGSCKVRKENLLATPEAFDPLPLGKIALPNVVSNLRFHIERDGIFHALAGWVE